MDKIEFEPPPNWGKFKDGTEMEETVVARENRELQTKLASAIEVLRLLANPEFWDCLEPECGGVGSCQNDSHSKVVWITHAEGNGYDDARKWLEENDK